MKSIVYIKSYNTPQIDKNEVLRYASSGGECADVEALLDECVKEISGKLSFKVCYSRYSISKSCDIIDLGFAKVRSHSLSLCLEECDEIILFCASIGLEIDRLIAKYGYISPAKATMFQAIGSERVEALCDAFCEDMAGEIGGNLRPRFSPGYGDLPLDIQKDIFVALDPAKRIGVSLGDNLFMTPSKSVTAIIGIKRKNK